MTRKIYIVLVACLFIVTHLRAQQCAQPPTVSASWSCNMAALLWSVNSNALYYDYKLDSSGVTVAQGSIPGNNTQVFNLSPSTVYIAMARSICGAGDTSAWGMFTFTTPPCGCVQPSWITAIPASCDSIVFSWDSVANVGYEYAITLTPTPPATGWMTTSVENASMGGLQGSTVYYIHVRANCGDNSYSPVKTIIITTPPCPAPTAIREMPSSIKSVFPNPSTTIIYLELHELKAGATVEVFDAGGRLLQQRHSSSTKISLDISGYSTGVYTIRYRDNETVGVYQFYKL